MTIGNTASQTTAYGNGVTSTFSFSFDTPSTSVISVLYTNADGNITLLTPNQFSVTLNAIGTGQLWARGGTVTYPLSGDPIADGTSLLIFRTVPLAQSVTIQNQGNFYPVVTERAIDTQCMELQQVSARTGQILGTWITGYAYNYGDIVQDGTNGDDTGNLYMCVVANTSNVWQSDNTAGYWSLAFNVQQVSGYATAAAASAAAAAVSAAAASTSASNASTSASTASSSASTASSAATAAGISAANAATSEMNAATSASNASSSASAASSSATTASAAAVTATTQATNASNSASAAASSASSASASATAAAASASQAAGTLLGTSATSNSIGTGSKSFTTQSGLALGAGGFVTIAQTSSPGNYMHGQVTSYSGTSLVVNVLDTGGSGTIAAWTITTSSPQGPAGAGSGTVTSSAGGQIPYYAATGDTVVGNANVTVSSGAVTLGQAGSVQGSLVLSGSTSGTTTLAAPAAGTGTMTLQVGTDTVVGRATTDTLTHKTLTSDTDVLGGVTMTLGSDGVGDIYYRNSGGVLTRLANGGANTLLHGSGTVPAYSAVVEADLSLSDVTTGNVTSSAHGFAPKSGADATTFLNGAATPTYAAVKDSDLSTSDITTNNATTSKHGFLPKLSGTSTQFLNGNGTFTTPSITPAQPQMTVFTASGTFTTSANITSSTVFKFTIVGGGGGGGGAASSGSPLHTGAGGGAGATVIYVISGLSPSTGYTVTVGAAGTAGTSTTSTGGTGGTGGASSVTVGANPSAGGGIGGTGNSASAAVTGGAGGAGSNGTINIAGGAGTNGIPNSTNPSAGTGGASSMGGGGVGATALSTAGSAGSAYGSGGGGGSQAIGGAGKAGIVIVEWFE